jgi:hypothetical protein
MSGIDLLKSLFVLIGAVAGMLLTARHINKQMVRFTRNEVATFMGLGTFIGAGVFYTILYFVEKWI